MSKPSYADLEKRIHELEDNIVSLKDSSEEYHHFLNNVTEAISLHKMITDDEGNIIDFTYEEVNPARSRLLGLSISDLKNKTVREVNPDVADEFIRKFGKAAISGTPLNFEFFSGLLKKHLNVKVFSPKYGYVATIIEDVSEQKKAEKLIRDTAEKYRTVFENSVDGIILINDTGTISEWNKFIADKTGVSKEEAIGMKLWDVQFSLLTEDWKPDYPVETLRKIWMDLVQNLKENEIVTREGQFISRDKKLVLTEELICPIILNDQKYLCILQRDLTERRRAEQKLKQSEEKLRELNATKDKLFAIIAHDLRSPFNSILGYSRLLGENLKTSRIEESQNYLDIINSSAHNTYNLLVNLLSWAKNQTGQTIFNPEVLILNKLVDEVVELLSSSAKIKNITIIHSLSEKIRIEADKNMVKTILQNLVFNAVKFTDNGGSITISAILSGDKIEISVSDTGIGISRKSQKKLFQIETNVATAGTSNESGSGLGLVLCREFAERHGGRIWVESSVGKGSSFKFTLPRAKGK